MTKSGTGTWDLGREDSGTPGRGTRGRRDVGLGDAGTWDMGRGDVGMWDARTSGREDMPINKQHLKFALNLQFTIFGRWTRKRKVLCDGEFDSS